MGIEWTDEAIQAALDKWDIVQTDEDSPYSDMRAALDAAVKAQFERATNVAMLYAYEAGEAYGRAEALEEAAKLRNEIPNYWQKAEDALDEYAAQIRALKDSDAPTVAGSEDAP